MITPPRTVKGGPWEMHGQWAMDFQAERGTADFVADMTMSDYGSTGGVADATQGGQNPHTHHIKLTNVRITWDMVGCPTFSPATTLGFQVNGTVSLITGNGGQCPVRDDATQHYAAGLCDRRERGFVLEYDDGVWRTCDHSFRDAGDSRRGAQDDHRSGGERVSWAEARFLVAHTRAAPLSKSEGQMRRCRICPSLRWARLS